MSRVIASHTKTAMKGPEMDWNYVPRNSTEENALYKYAFKLIGTEYVAKIVALRTLNEEPLKMNIDFRVFGEGNKGTTTGKKHTDMEFTYIEGSALRGKTLKVDMPRAGKYERDLIINIDRGVGNFVDPKYNVDTKREEFEITKEELKAAKELAKTLNLPKK